MKITARIKYNQNLALLRGIESVQHNNSALKCGQNAPKCAINKIKGSIHAIRARALLSPLSCRASLG